jgi:hypothetical protein
VVNRDQDPVRVYIPHPESSLVRSIDRGSGIVGVDAGGGRVLIYYEGNRYGAENLVRYAERVEQADGRLQSDYPTVARAVVAAREVVPIGWWHRLERQLELEAPATELSWWVDLSDPAEVTLS